MSISNEELRVLGDMIQDRIHALLREIAVPKPSRASEHYAALTFSIVLLREQIMPENTPADRKVVVHHELAELIKKRSELEAEFENQNRTGGS